LRTWRTRNIVGLGGGGKEERGEERGLQASTRGANL